MTDTPETPRPGAEVLDAIEVFVKDYIVLPHEAHTAAIALWVAHTHALEAADATPYLLITSPEKRSGKSRLLEVLELVVARPWRVAGTSEAALFRKIEQDQPTLLLDEIDPMFQGSTERVEPIRAVINAGNRRGGAISRCVGQGGGQSVESFGVFCPKILAGIATTAIPDTISDRSIRIQVERKKPHEKVRRFRYRRASVEASGIQERIEHWVESRLDSLMSAEPELPERLDDRAWEAWEPLASIADEAGGAWPERARAAALYLSTGEAVEDESAGVHLLIDLRLAFRGIEVAFSEQLCQSLNRREESPWTELRNGAGITPRLLARMLRPYRIQPRTVRIGSRTAKGYRAEQFTEAWSRYVPDPGPEASQPSPPASDADAGEDDDRHEEQV